jgi:hydrogenase maturation protease
MSEPTPARTLVLGLGNPIMGDDGFGLAVLERLLAGWLLPDEIEVVDGGTWGMSLLPLIETPGRLLVLDAIDAGLDPGSTVVLEGPQLPRYFAHKLSPHQIDLREVLALAELRGTLPPEIVALGVQPARVELLAELSPILAAKVEATAELAVSRLEVWGHRCARVVEGPVDLGQDQSTPPARVLPGSTLPG